MTASDTVPPLKAMIVPVTPYVQNCSVIWCTETMKGAVIDPGGERPRIMEAVAEHKVELEKVLITHAHSDHAGAADALSKAEGIPIEGPQKEDQFWIDRLGGRGVRPGFEEEAPFVPDRWLEGGDTVTVGNQTLQVRHCPGHTPGHVIFFHEPSKLAIVGDVLFRGSIGRSDFPMGDHDKLIRSITEQLWPLGEDVVFISGHGEVSTFGQERQDNPFVADRVLGIS